MIAVVPKVVFAKIDDITPGYTGPRTQAMAEWFTRYNRTRDTIIRQKVRGVDPLTQLPTYADFMPRVLEIGKQRKEAKKAHQEDESNPPPEPCTIIACDLNHFKLFNDKYFGYATTDQLIKAFAKTLKSELRQEQSGDAPTMERRATRARGSDYLARAKQRGDEFMIIMRDCNEEEANRRMQAICEKLAGKTFLVPGKNGQHFSLTNLSMAFGCYELDSQLEKHESHDRPHDAVKKAEDRMHAHKRSMKGGRSDVVLNPEDPTLPEVKPVSPADLPALQAQPEVVPVQKPVVRRAAATRA